MHILAILHHVLTTVIRDLPIWLVKISIIEIPQLMDVTSCAEEHDSYLIKCSSTT